MKNNIWFVWKQWNVAEQLKTIDFTSQYQKRQQSGCVWFSNHNKKKI